MAAEQKANEQKEENVPPNIMIDDEPQFNQLACNDLMKFIKEYDAILSNIEMESNLKSVNQLLIGQVAAGAQEVYVLQSLNELVTLH